MRISDWSSDVCSSDLLPDAAQVETDAQAGWYGALAIGHQAGRGKIADPRAAERSAVRRTQIGEQEKAVARAGTRRAAATIILIAIHRQRPARSLEFPATLPWRHGQKEIGRAHV